MNKKGKDIVGELEEIVPGLRLPAETPYQAPAGYFEQLPGQIMQRIQAENAATVQDELAALSPLLAAAPRQQPMSAPQGYFDGLADRIMNDIQSGTTANPAKVVPIRSRRRYLSWAAAACLTGCIALGALFIFRHNPAPATNFEAQLAGIPDQEIVDYLQNHTDAFDNEAIFSNVSKMDVADELPRISTNLYDMPEAAIEKYLENSGLSN
ncbi:hypothetical protein F0L74_00410 [Chitinophaga agrisoli]|uniref:Uncharacterized protein n=1 Tax=Chitinophaga agrisoli TaxID=2607653 RepID=A0A5B2W2K3_9BACT|nr:hypothetical protein [Chitinophaga agrisoli]KAA2244479.1 hypothetical protein F0L74_00410 [Chitinophaga agrisoli]